MAIPSAAFVFLIFDLYPVVDSFRAIGRTPSFWLLWFVFSLLNTIAYGILKVSYYDKIQVALGRDISFLGLLILATLGTITVVQSLTLKVHGQTLVDLGKFIDTFRSRVLSDIQRRSADMQRLKAMQLAGRLEQASVLDLRKVYFTVMAFGGKSTAQISLDLTNLEAQARNSGLSIENLLATRVALADAAAVEELLTQRGL